MSSGPPRAEKYLRMADAILVRNMVAGNKAFKQSLANSPTATAAGAPTATAAAPWTPPEARLAPEEEAVVAAATAAQESMVNLKIKLHTLVAQLKVAGTMGVIAGGGSGSPASASTSGARFHRRRLPAIHGDVHGLVDEGLALLDAALAAQMLSLRGREPGGRGNPAAVGAATQTEVSWEASRAELAALRSSAAASEAQVEALSGVVVELEREVRKLEHDRERDRERERERERRDDDGMRAAYEQRVDMMEKSLNERTGRLMEVESHLSTALNNIDQLTVELDDYKAAVDEFRKDRKATRVKLRDTLLELQAVKDASQHSQSTAAAAAAATDPERVAKLEAKILSQKEKGRLMKEKLRTLIEENKALVVANPEGAVVYRVLRDLTVAYQSTLASTCVACHSCSHVHGLVSWSSFPTEAHGFEQAVQALECTQCAAKLFIPPPRAQTC